MRKKISWTLGLLVAFGLLANILLGNSTKYPAGKDTIETFGDGTYQISSGSTDSLFNEKYGSCIIQKVEKFREVNQKVYLLGSTTQEHVAGEAKVECGYKIYSLIELEDNTMTLCVIPNYAFCPEIYIYRFDEMLDNCDVQFVSALSEFSDEDYSVFLEFE